MSYPSFNVVTSKHACSFIGGVEVFDIRGKASPRRPIAGVVSSPDNHQSLRIHRATNSYPCSKLRSMLPLLPGRVPIYRSRFAASQLSIVGTLHPLEVNLLSGLRYCSFLFRRKLWMMGTDIPLDITSLQMLLYLFTLWDECMPFLR